MILLLRSGPGAAASCSRSPWATPSGTKGIVGYLGDAIVAVVVAVVVVIVVVVAVVVAVVFAIVATIVATTVGAVVVVVVTAGVVVEDVVVFPPWIKAQFLRSG